MNKAKSKRTPADDEKTSEPRKKKVQVEIEQLHSAKLAWLQNEKKEDSKCSYGLKSAIITPAKAS